jgi:hypothetical protein
MWDDLGAQANAAANPGPDPVAADPFYAGVQQAVSQSLEEMCFMPVLEEAVLLASLPVLEPCPGDIHLQIQERIAREIALSIYACEPDALTEKMVDDAIGELINTVAGQLLALRLPDDHVFTLGLPTVSRESSFAYDVPARSAVFKVSDGFVETLVTGEPLLAVVNSAAKTI